jgi:hypothetical protein
MSPASFTPQELFEHTKTAGVGGGCHNLTETPGP